eukprot:6011791-Alexandrium_andersonii.AAC.1
MQGYARTHWPCVAVFPRSPLTCIGRCFSCPTFSLVETTLGQCSIAFNADLTARDARSRVLPLRFARAPSTVDHKT